MKFGRFVAAAFVRLVMGYLFLFNTFCVVVQATAVLDIFFDVLALQFLQQLDDISFNLSCIRKAYEESCLVQMLLCRV